MVLVVLLEGNHPTIYHGKNEANRGGAEGKVIGYLLTGMARWETFHAPSDSERNRWVTVAEYGYPVKVPAAMVRYRDERAANADVDLYPGYPGVMPTIHRGGTGQRKVLILNFSHMAEVKNESIELVSVRRIRATPMFRHVPDGCGS